MSAGSMLVKKDNLVYFPTIGQGTASGFYTPSDASRIARLPRGTLDAWRREGIVVPTIEWKDTEGKKEKGYTFDALVFLRLIRMLRDHDITLRKAVGAVYELSHRFGRPGPAWEEARVFSWGEDVFVYGKDEWETTTATRQSQKVADLLFGEEFERLRDRTDSLLVPRRFQEYVEIEPTRRNGLPVVLDTNVLTSVIHALRIQGLTYLAIHREYPFIETRKVRGADRYEQFLDAESAAA